MVSGRSFFRWKYFPLVIVVVLTILTHGINLWHYPYFEDDEGTYTSQGWWLVGLRQLGPYTYWYDHSPFGWFQVGVWQTVTGGPFAFGFSIYSTRVFMLLIAAISAALVFGIAKDLTKEDRYGYLAAVIFIFSPMAIYFHRRVLLDNIETVWILSSFWLVIRSRSHLWRLMLSGGFFGWAFLSKESALFLLPAMVYAVWVFTKRENRFFGVVVWITTAIFVMGIYPFMAIFKHEFFPAEWFGETAQHTSLVQSILYQLGRGSGLMPWSVNSEFYKTLTVSWWFKDPVFVVLGLWGILVGLWRMFFSREIRILVFLVLSYVLFLVKGNVLDFYIIPLIPLLGILLAMNFSWVTKRLPLQKFNGAILWFFALVGLGGVLIWAKAGDLFLRDETKSQLASLEYVKKNISPDSVLAVDDSILIDLRFPTKDGPAFPYAHWFSKIENDSAVRFGVLGGRWERINNIVLSHEMVQQASQGNTPFLKNAIDSSQVIVDLPPPVGTFRDLGTLRSTNGDWASVLRVGTSLGQQLSSSPFGDVMKDETLVARIKSTMAKMTLEEKAAELFWVTLSGSKVSDEEAKFLEGVRPGGILLSGENVVNENQLIDLVSKLVVSSESEILRQPLVVIDQEGGAVARIPFEKNSYIAQAEIISTQQAHDLALTRGRSLRFWGIGVNLAPVGDVSRNAFTTIARDRRGFLGSESDVADMVASSIGGYKEAGILPVVKHFPGGLGRTGTDPHISLPSIDISAGDLFGDMMPFRRAIDSGVKAIMVGHLLYPKIDPEMPTSLSKIFVTDILRGQLGFLGLVVDDDISMGALSEKFTTDQIVENAINAGVDVMLLTGSISEETVARDALVKAVEEGRVSQERIDESVFRALLFKAGYL